MSVSPLSDVGEGAWTRHSTALVLPIQRKSGDQACFRSMHYLASISLMVRPHAGSCSAGRNLSCHFRAILAPHPWDSKLSVPLQLSLSWVLMLLCLFGLLLALGRLGFQSFLVFFFFSMFTCVSQCHLFCAMGGTVEYQHTNSFILLHTWTVNWFHARATPSWHDHMMFLCCASSVSCRE